MFFDIDTPIKATGFGRIEQSNGFWHKIWARREFLLFHLALGNLVMSVGNK